MTEAKQKQTTLTGGQVLREKLTSEEPKKNILEDIIITQLKSSMIINHLSSKNEDK